MINDKDKFEMLKQLTAVGFSLYDLHLYLNTHPMDKNALEKYNAFLMQNNMLKQNYEKNYGPLTAGDSINASPWQWIGEPWPWEYEANFSMNEGEK